MNWVSGIGKEYQLQLNNFWDWKTFLTIEAPVRQRWDERWAVKWSWLK